MCSVAVSVPCASRVGCAWLGAGSMYGLMVGWLGAEQVRSSPILSPDGSVVYVGSYDNNLYAVNTADGSQKWAFAAGRYMGDSVSICAQCWRSVHRVLAVLGWMLVRWLG